MHILWAYSPRVYHYVLDFDPLSVEVGEDYELWPTPRDYYLARKAIRTGDSWTIAEYDTYMTAPSIEAMAILNIEEGAIDDSEVAPMSDAA